MRKVALTRFLRSFLIFLFPKTLLHTFLKASQTPFGSVKFIFEVAVLEKLFYLRTDEITFLYLGLAYVWEYLP
jgi:hypothetical protein